MSALLDDIARDVVRLCRRAARRFPRTAAFYRSVIQPKRARQRVAAVAEELLDWGQRKRIGSLITHAMGGLRGRVAIVVVPADYLLLGTESGLPADEEARLGGPLLAPSTPLPRWAEVRLLERRLEHRETAIEDGLVPSSERTNPESRTERYDTISFDPQVRVRRVRASDCYQVVSGHHRLAASYVRGRRSAAVIVEPGAVWTPLQQMLRQMSWLEGRRELYQPIDSPELAKEWVLVRRCTDRLAYMTAFLAQADLATPQSLGYLDIGSCYGWFVAEMLPLGFDAHGMESDPLGPVLGEAVYGLDRRRVLVGDCAVLLQRYPVTDVVSCFSLLHHFVDGHGSCSAEELIARISRVTRRVLFLDTGESHESWLAGTHDDWTPDYIEDWLRRNADFDEIHRLGTDHDAVPPFENNYGRTLFACVRKAT